MARKCFGVEGNNRRENIEQNWWRWRDLNPHGAKLRQILSLLRLPVPPHRHAPNSNTTRRANLRLTARHLAPLLARFAFRRLHSRSPCPHLQIPPRVQLRKVARVPRLRLRQLRLAAPAASGCSSPSSFKTPSATTPSSGSSAFSSSKPSPTKINATSGSSSSFLSSLPFPSSSSRFPVAISPTNTASAASPSA